MKAVVIAGGEGKRIESIGRGIPKSLLDVGGRPVVEHQIVLLRRYGIREIHLTVRARDLPIFRDRLGKGERWGVTLRYHAEHKPLGTAGSVAPIIGRLSRNFIVLYGDVMINMDLGALAEFRRETKATAALVVHPTDHPLDSDLVELDGQNRVRRLHLKPRPSSPLCRNLGNAGAYALSQRIADFIPDGASDFMQDVFPRALDTRAALFGYRTREYLKDIGTPDRIKTVRADWALGRIERRHRDCALPAVFFDRDGTLCEDVPHLHKVRDLKLLPGAAEAVRRVNEADSLAVVVTNQPVVARGLCSSEDLEHIHAKLEILLGEEGARLDGIYYCPHHPDGGFPGEVAELKVECDCRKPEGGLIERAETDLNIDVARSTMIGDSTVDVETGLRLGLRTILVQTGEAGHDGKFAARPEATYADVAEAVSRILDE